jgi:hypothetical protein
LFIFYFQWTFQISAQNIWPFWKHWKLDNFNRGLHSFWLVDLKIDSLDIVVMMLIPYMVDS